MACRRSVDRRLILTFATCTRTQHCTDMLYWTDILGFPLRSSICTDIWHQLTLPCFCLIKRSYNLSKTSGRIRFKSPLAGEKLDFFSQMSRATWWDLSIIAPLSILSIYPGDRSPLGPRIFKSSYSFQSTGMTRFWPSSINIIVARLFLRRAEARRISSAISEGA